MHTLDYRPHFDHTKYFTTVLFTVAFTSMSLHLLMIKRDLLLSFFYFFRTFKEVFRNCFLVCKNIGHVKVVSLCFFQPAQSVILVYCVFLRKYGPYSPNLDSKPELCRFEGRCPHSNFLIYDFLHLLDVPAASYLSMRCSD